MNKNEWDYIIVGAGSAGCILANRISSAGHRVLLFEVGNSDKNFWVRLPVGYFKTFSDDRFTRHFKTESQIETFNRNIMWPRGRLLGGSSSINGLIYIRGQHADFDDWVKLGAKGWSYREVLPYFKRSECYLGQAGDYHGVDGELGVSDLQNNDPNCAAWLQAAQEYGLPFNHDFNASTDYGVGRYKVSIKGRWRSSSSVAFLRPALNRNNLKVITGTLVSKVLIEKGRALGVECYHHGEKKRFFASNEVILSAGSIQSPQLLQLSGVGPADHLQSLGIDVVQEAPEVGLNLQDHYQARTIVRLKKATSLNNQIRSPIALAKMGMQWLLDASGPLTVSAAQVGGFAKTSLASDDRSDIQFSVMPLSLDKPGERLHRYPGFTVTVCQCRPESSGKLAIVSSDPKQAPRIHTNYLKESRDINTLVEGLEMCRDIYKQKSFTNRWIEEMAPGQQTLEHYARSTGTTTYHPTSTCRMGSDDRAVVSPELKVNGVENLRVIDASVMPKVLSANTNATTMMIAEKGAEFILTR